MITRERNLRLPTKPNIIGMWIFIQKLVLVRQTTEACSFKQLIAVTLESLAERRQASCGPLCQS